MSNNELEVQRSQSSWWFACVDVDVWDDDTLSTIDKSVFTVLCIHASIGRRDCRLKIETIARKASCSVRSVQKSMKKLTERGLIKREERFYEGKQISSHFEIVGHEAPCYRENEGCTTCVPRTTCTDGVQDVRTENDNSLNDIKDSLTREAPLPDEPILVFENGQTVENPESPKPNNPEEVCTPDDAPNVMKATAELLLFKTGRKGLTWDEISALRKLSASQFPSRVNKEIDTAVKRFCKRDQPLSELTFGYIAGSLSHQPTRGKKRKLPKTAKPAEVPTCTDEQAEAEMAEIEAMQAKFDREDEERRRGSK